MSNRNEMLRMQKEYGRCVDKCCRQCCNYQLKAPEKPYHFCLAYGEKYVDDWSGTTEACGLFNRPFYAQRIRCKPLGIQYEKQTDANSELDGQISLFTI